MRHIHACNVEQEAHTEPYKIAKFPSSAPKVCQSIQKHSAHKDNHLDVAPHWRDLRQDPRRSDLGAGRSTLRQFPLPQGRMGPSQPREERSSRTAAVCVTRRRDGSTSVGQKRARNSRGKVTALEMASWICVWRRPSVARRGGVVATRPRRTGEGQRYPPIRGQFDGRTNFPRPLSQRRSVAISE